MHHMQLDFNSTSAFCAKHLIMVYICDTSASFAPVSCGPCHFFDQCAVNHANNRVGTDQQWATAARFACFSMLPSLVGDGVGSDVVMFVGSAVGITVGNKVGSGVGNQVGLDVGGSVPSCVKTSHSPGEELANGCR